MSSSSYYSAPVILLSFLFGLISEDYAMLLDEAPVLTKAITSATVYFIGDIIAQKSEGCQRIEWMRVLRSLLAGGLGHGPMSHYWYKYSENLFEELEWTAWWTVFLKVLLDQCTWGPFWNNTYIIILGIMKLQSPRTILRDIRRTTVPLIVSGLKVWFPAHCITYGVIHVEYRLLWVDMVEILWVTILATQAAGKTKQKKNKKSKRPSIGKRKTSQLTLNPSSDEMELSPSVAQQSSNPNEPRVLVVVDPYEAIPAPTKGGRSVVHQTNVHRSSAKERRPSTDVTNTRNGSSSSSGHTNKVMRKHMEIPEVKIHYS